MTKKFLTGSKNIINVMNASESFKKLIASYRAGVINFVKHKFSLKAVKNHRKEVTMSKTKRGVRDGSGPYSGSYQSKKHGGKGRRRMAGAKCPKR